MRIILNSTAKVVELVNGNGGHVNARVWEGTTDDGVNVLALVCRITPTEDEADLADFERDLLTTVPPLAGLSVPNRMLL